MSVTMLLEMAADGFGARPIIGRRTVDLTVDRLRLMARDRGRLLQENDAEAVVYLTVNGPALPVALFAAAYAGIPLVPLNYRLGAEQLTRLLAQHPGAVVIAEPSAHPLLTVPDERRFTPDEWLTGPWRQVDDVDPDHLERPAAIIYTSGTTSEPKGVVLRHENLVSYVVSTVDFASAAETDAALMSVPPYHIAALANILTNLYAGRRFIVLDKFQASDWVGLVREEGVTHAMVVPTMLARILDLGDHRVATLRTLSYGGAPMPTAVIERALRAWPEVDFVNAYGLTETSSTISVLTPEDHRASIAAVDPGVRARLGSAGQVLPHIELEVRDEDGIVVPRGRKGRIWVRGPQVSGEYVGLGRVTDDEGFFDTRDDGRLDDDGYLFIEGRSDDTIIRGAENIAPAEIEDVLMRHASVLDAAVVGVPDQEWGQRVVAVAVLRQGHPASATELQDFVRSALRSSKTPDQVEFWDELPRTETGKLLRRTVLSQLGR